MAFELSTAGQLPQPFSAARLPALLGSDAGYLTAADVAGSLPGTHLPETHGAIRDGANHPLSERYGTLAQAQAVYPKATALTQSIDGAAIQKAIDTAAATGGGTVRLGAGAYVCNGWTLVIPESSEGGTTQVNIAGQGTAATKLRWTADMGAGKYAICCGDPAANNTNDLGRYAGVSARYEGYCADFSLIGPAGPTAYGAAAATQMIGFGWGDRRQMMRIASAQWFAGYEVVGGQADWYHCWGISNHYGIYWGTVSDYNWGDISFIKCWFGQSSMAAVGVKANGVMVSADFRTCFFGTSPYAFYKEPGALGWIAGFVSNCTFHQCQFEAYGNSCFRDGNGSATANTDTGYAAGLYHTHFYEPFFIKNTGYASASHPAKAVFDLYNFDRCVIRSPRDPGQLQAMNESVFRLTTINGLRLEGSGWQSCFEAAANANKVFSGGGSTNTLALAGVVWEDVLGGRSGIVARTATGATIAAQQMLEFNGARVSPASTDARVPAGVALVGSSSDLPAIVVTKANSVSVALEGGVSLVSGAAVKKGAGGGVASYNDAGWTVGVVREANTATSTRIALMLGGKSVAGSGGGGSTNTTTIPKTVKTETTYTLALADAGTLLEMDLASAGDIWIPPNNIVAFPVDTVLQVRWVGTGQPTIRCAAGVTSRPVLTTPIPAQWRTVSLHQRALNDWVVDGA